MLFTELLVKLTVKGAVQELAGFGVVVKDEVGELDVVIKLVLVMDESQPLASVTIKETEKITNHDVKAVEYFLKKQLFSVKYLFLIFDIQANKKIYFVYIFQSS